MSGQLITDSTDEISSRVAGSNIVIPGDHKYFRMDIESDDSIFMIPASIAFREAAKRRLDMATIDWDWSIKNDVAGAIASTGISESFLLDIGVDLKEEIEDHLFIKRNDTIYLVYDFLADVEIGKDVEGKTMQTVTERISPKYLINPATNKAIKLNNKMEEFENEYA